MSNLMVAGLEKVSFAVHVAHVVNVLYRLHAGVGGMEFASSFAWTPSFGTAFCARAMGRRKRLRVFPRSV
jgi:hypothetical protein